jgi:hypothetical protein
MLVRDSGGPEKRLRKNEVGQEQSFRTRPATHRRHTVEQAKVADQSAVELTPTRSLRGRTTQNSEIWTYLNQKREHPPIKDTCRQD